MSRKVTVKVQSRSGFDKSFQNMLTANVGTLVPLLCDEVIPNTTVSLSAALSASLPPLVSDTFMRCQVRTEAFFVPFRLLCGGYSYWQVQQKIGVPGSEAVPSLPSFKYGTSPTPGSAYFGNGTLSDYLGFRLKDNSSLTGVNFSLLPFLAYHLIWDTWYRNKRVQKQIFFPYLNSNSRGIRYIEHMPYVAQSANSYDIYGSVDRQALTFVDGVDFRSLRQRNFDDDYFTSAQTTPQMGQSNAMEVSFPTSGSSSSFSISDLRAANSLQQFLERNNILGYDLQNYVKGQYGADLSDGVCNRPLYLGSASYDVYSKGIYQTAYPDPNVSPANPFGDNVGATYGSASAGGNFGLIKNFTANESGYIFVMVSLVPKVTYSSGVLRQNYRYTAQGVDNRADMANPILQNIGNDAIWVSELVEDASQFTVPFGYTDRYADYMVRNDELHGELRDGGTLRSFALQRFFPAGGSLPSLSSAFLEIPKTYLDDVLTMNNATAKFSYWLDSWLDYKVIMPLARYSIPSLQNPAIEHGQSVTVDVNGKHV